jgi:hypothetical protein
MNHRIIIAHNDELWEIISDSLGGLVSAVLYYDTRMTAGEEVPLRAVPDKVVSEVHKYLSKVKKS